MTDYQILDQKRATYEPGAVITVKLLKFADGNISERYYMYSQPGITTCRGLGWKSLEKLIARYRWYKKQGFIKAPAPKPPKPPKTKTQSELLAEKFFGV